MTVTTKVITVALLLRGLKIGSRENVVSKNAAVDTPLLYVSMFKIFKGDFTFDALIRKYLKMLFKEKYLSHSRV